MRLLSKTSPWYTAGLAFECTGCGRCCAGPAEGYVWVTAAQAAAIADLLGMDERAFRERFVRKLGKRLSLIEDPKTRDCVFLEPAQDGARRCRIYAARPPQCRTWPFWPANLTSAQRWALAGMRCPGVNRGCLHSREHIEQQRDATG